MVDGPGGDPPLDRFDRDRCRHPMQWSPEGGGGFSAGRAWLPAIDPERRSVEAQREDPSSILNLFRRLIELRREISGAPERLQAAPGVLAFRRDRHTIVVNATPYSQPVGRGGETVLTSAEGVFAGAKLAAGAAVVLR